MDIAGKFGLPASVLESILICLSNIRNICAHYGRLWNRYIVTPPPDVKFNKKGFNYSMTFGESHKFFPVFYIIAFMLKMIAPDSKWCSLVRRQIKSFQDRTSRGLGRDALISFEKMGFPVGWEDYPLFEEMLENE